MSLGLKAPSNPADYWDVPGADLAAQAGNATAAVANGGMLEKFGSFFSGAAGSALSGLAGATPYGAIANVVGSAIKDAPLTQTAEGGRISNRQAGDRIINVGSGTQATAKTTAPGPLNPWMIGGVVIAGLLALKIMKG